jgi:hypothetical protein
MSGLGRQPSGGFNTIVSLTGSRLGVQSRWTSDFSISAAAEVRGSTVGRNYAKIAKVRQCSDFAAVCPLPSAAEPHSSQAGIRQLSGSY